MPRSGVELPQMAAFRRSAIFAGRPRAERTSTTWLPSQQQHNGGRGGCCLPSLRYSRSRETLGCCYNFLYAGTLLPLGRAFRAKRKTGPSLRRTLVQVHSHQPQLGVQSNQYDNPSKDWVVCHFGFAHGASFVRKKRSVRSFSSSAFPPDYFGRRNATV